MCTYSRWPKFGHVFPLNIKQILITDNMEKGVLFVQVRWEILIFRGSQFLAYCLLPYYARSKIKWGPLGWETVTNLFDSWGDRNKAKQRARVFCIGVENWTKREFVANMMGRTNWRVAVIIGINTCSSKLLYYIPSYVLGTDQVSFIFIHEPWYFVTKIVLTYCEKKLF